MLCLMQKIGYGRWEEIKLEIRKAWQFRFDWFIKSRTPQELQRRGDLIVRLIKNERDILNGIEPTYKRRKSQGGGRRKKAKVEEEEDDEEEEDEDEDEDDDDE